MCKLSKTHKPKIKIIEMASVRETDNADSFDTTETTKIDTHIGRVYYLQK